MFHKKRENEEIISFYTLHQTGSPSGKNFWKSRGLIFANIQENETENVSRKFDGEILKDKISWIFNLVHKSHTILLQRAITKYIFIRGPFKLYINHWNQLDFYLEN